MNIQSDISDEALVTAIRANICEFFRLLQKASPPDDFSNERFTRWETGLPHPWFNGVLSSTAPTQGDEDFIQDTIAHFRKKETNEFSWWLEPHLRSVDWAPLLSGFGFGFSDDTPGMAVDLNGLNDLAKVPDAFEIRAVTDEENLYQWTKTFVHGYGLSRDWEGPLLNLWKRFGFELPIRNYLGYLRGKPVSTSTIILGGGVAGVYCVATVPHARGKGLGAAITLQPLLEFQRAGYRIGVLQSSEMGYRIYQRLGFRHLCQIEYFFLG